MEVRALPPIPPAVYEAPVYIIPRQMDYLTCRLSEGHPLKMFLDDTTWGNDAKYLDEFYRLLCRICRDPVWEWGMPLRVGSKTHILQAIDRWRPSLLILSAQVTRMRAAFGFPAECKKFKFDYGSEPDQYTYFCTCKNGVFLSGNEEYDYGNGSYTRCTVINELLGAIGAALLAIPPYDPYYQKDTEAEVYVCFYTAEVRSLYPAVRKRMPRRLVQISRMENKRWPEQWSNIVRYVRGMWYPEIPTWMARVSDLCRALDALYLEMRKYLGLKARMVKSELEKIEHDFVQWKKEHEK